MRHSSDDSIVVSPGANPHGVHGEPASVRNAYDRLVDKSEKGEAAPGRGTRGGGAGSRGPMVLVVPDEAAGLLSVRSLEGDLARWFVEHAVRYGRKAGVGVSASRETVDRLAGPGHNLRFILRATP